MAEKVLGQEKIISSQAIVQPPLFNKEGGIKMCVLCGESVLRVHWTDKNLDRKDRSSSTEVGQFQRSRIRERMHRIRLANRILSLYGLKIEDWNGSKYVLRDKKGRSEIVHDLGSLWPAAAKLTGYSLDPLDPTLLQNLASQTN